MTPIVPGAIAACPVLTFDSGDGIRVDPKAVVFSSPGTQRDIHCVKANVTGANTYELWQRTENDDHTANTTDVVLHRYKRRLWNLVFIEKFYARPKTSQYRTQIDGMSPWQTATLKLQNEELG